jgi:hypothetical protein
MHEMRCPYRKVSEPSVVVRVAMACGSAAFHGLDAATMAKALAVLQAEGKADTFPKADLDEMGVIFKGA